MLFQYEFSYMWDREGDQILGGEKKSWKNGANANE
jgi:hypothetical protein